MRLVTAADIERLSELADAENGHSQLAYELSGFAAERSLGYLVDHWRDVVLHGGVTEVSDFSTGSILSDLDDVIAQLQAFRRDAEAILQ